jgi:superfamily II DNA helicase RecQ
VRFTLYIE